MTLVTIIIYNRLENLKRWLNCWSQCNQENAELIVIHNYDILSQQKPYRDLCEKYGIKYYPRLNKGFDIGALKDVCSGQLKVPDFNELLWITDDTIPMSKDFVNQFRLKDEGIRCMEISSIRSPLHVRTTGFCISKETASKIIFPKNIITKEHCYHFEHRGGDMTLMKQVEAMGLKCVQVAKLEKSPLWDTQNRAHLHRMKEHDSVFTPTALNEHVTIICPIFNSFPEIIGSMICQTHKNWTLKLIHDGPNETGLKELVNQIGDNRIEYSETKQRAGNWGHSIRAEQIKKLDDTDFVLITNADNHHVPVYLEWMIKGITDRHIASYCSDMVHSYKAWQIIPCRLERGYVDCAGVLIRAEVAKSIGWRDVSSHSSDWFFFSDILKKHGFNRFARVKGCLLIHN